MKSGAFEFFTKPFDDAALLEAVRQAIARYCQAPSRRAKGTPHIFEEVVGISPALKSALNRVASVARTDSTVLILGETGTGKELVARAIHAQSQRSARPLVSVNCAAIQPSLIASELFGHE
jgi:DNA-binding NtrC family response regulator